ncbi:hypothetical protein ACGF1Z_09775 [Streptomyces sp. NPDC048018]|uniref:hypothetical protein n=1 Tax=Streptomyces sp. NPDC048018 TaxID=3365499 RepID=UPI00372035D4
MTDTATTAVTALLAATGQQGPGDTLRIVLLVSIVGAALLAWFLLRGYRNGGADTGDTEGPRGDARTTATRRQDGPGDANA